MQFPESRTVQITMATIVSVLLCLALFTVNLHMLQGNENCIIAITDVYGWAIAGLCAAGGVSAPVKKLGDAWQAGRSA